MQLTGGKVGEITQKLYDTLTGIQTGKDRRHLRLGQVYRMTTCQASAGSPPEASWMWTP